MKVAFYKGEKRIFNRLTRFWLRGNYSHCELILGTDANGMSICASSSMMDGGVRVKHMRLDPEHWDIVPVSGSADAAWSWLRKHEGAGYDYLGLLGFIARAIGHNPSRFVCSEAVAEMLGMSDGWRFDPCSLYAALVWRETSADASADASAVTSTGLLAMLQSLLASVAQEAYAAGQEAERQQKQPVQVDDAYIIKST